MYEGPAIDAFLHGPWIGEDPAGARRADRVEWTGDRRLRRVMRTFGHSDADRLDVPRLLQRMDEANVERGILVAKVYYPAQADAVLDINRQFSELCGSSAGRLKWVASLIPPELGAGSYWDLMQNTRMIDVLAELPALCGVHITPSPWGLPPNDRWYYPVYAKCVERKLPLFAYVGAPGPLWPMDPNNPAHLDDVALAFPDLVIVAHHIGDPWTDMSVRLAARHDNFFICTSAWAPKAYPEPLREFLAGGWHGVEGCGKVVFASDFPLLDMRRAARAARALPLEAGQAEKFLYGNARRLFWENDAAD